MVHVPNRPSPKHIRVLTKQNVNLVKEVHNLKIVYAIYITIYRFYTNWLNGMCNADRITTYQSKSRTALPRYHYHSTKRFNLNIVLFLINASHIVHRIHTRLSNTCAPLSRTHLVSSSLSLSL